MKLNDLDRKNTAIKALRENFEINFNPNKMSKQVTRTMLTKVRNLIKEAKSDPNFYNNQTTPAYMKLVFMEQALANHYNKPSNKPARIVVENEEVEKSQVILAAQDMVDSVQKMIEDVSDMLVKELPALSDSIQSEIGVNEGNTFNQAATEALSNLSQALTQTKQTLQGALGGITGQGSAEAFGSEELPPAGDEMAAPEEMPPEEEVEVGAEEEIPAEEPEEAPVGGAGRAKR